MSEMGSESSGQSQAPLDVNAAIEAAVQRALAAQADATAKQQQALQTQIDSLRASSKPAAHFGTNAANVDAGPAAVGRTRGTIVKADQGIRTVVTAFAAFDYRQFLLPAKPYAAAIDATCVRVGYSQLKLFLQLCQESGFDSLATSTAGAIGIAQIMPDTAKDWGVDPHNPDASIWAMASHMKGYLETYLRDIRAGRFNGNGKDPHQFAFELALAAYDAGAGAVEDHGGVPPYPETQNYVFRIASTEAAILASEATRMRWIEDWNLLKVGQAVSPAA